MSNLTGPALIDHTAEKAAAGNLLTMREWRLLNLDTCSAARDVYFPEFCKKNGVSERAKLSASLWEPIWNAAMTQYSKEHQAFLDAYYASIGQPRRKQ